MTDVEVGGPLRLQGPAFPPAAAADAFSSPQDDHSSQGSLLSHHSQPADLAHTVDGVPDITGAAAVTNDITPPSSNASAAQDEEHLRSTGHDKSIPIQPSTVPAQEAVSLRRNSHSPHSSSSREGVAGSKRTATGEVKPAPDPEQRRPATADRFELDPARTASALSNGSSSNVTEVSRALSTVGAHADHEQISSQLRTRLKYAMLKVQNGWQTRSLDELESIASASPRSTASGFQHVQDRPTFASPQSRTNPRLHRQWSDSSSSESNRSDGQARGHHRPATNAATRSSRPHSSRSLAPPADIKPGMRRRPTPNNGLALSGMTASPMFHGRSPAVRPSPSQRTPSQNAAMEADAVETLLFMASPNNSGYKPPSQASQESSLRSTLIAQTSPLREQFSQTSVTSPKKVAFTDHQAPSHLRTREAQINHMLDTLPDDSDDDLDGAK